MRLLLASTWIRSTLRNTLKQLRPVSHSVASTKLTENSKLQLLSVVGINPNTKIHGFTVRQVQEIPELFMTVVRLTHDKTGADYVHVARDDDNNVFNVSFRTTPMDSTGVPHVLEHTVLCGSERYPCRDPFFKMANRSLATYMNALTDVRVVPEYWSLFKKNSTTSRGLDYTMYPFATQNQKDYQNMMSVYMDAVFAPCLRELDFKQEGWRLENENLEDPKSELTFKGIVFNEMKGAFANSEQLFAQRTLNNLLPSHTYAHVSGGDPLHIVDLSWDQLKNFHSTHYHPTNARFYTYGNFPLEGHLKFINERLKQFSPIKMDTSIPLEARWREPRITEISCRPDPLLPNPEKNTTVAKSYLLGCTSDTQETATLQILAMLLISEPNSPFFKALLEPNIGADYSPFAGYDYQTREGVFSIGLQGIRENDVPKVCDIIDSTIEEIIKNGFRTEDIEAVLHKIELDTKLVTANFGLNLSMFLMPLWHHEANVIEVLQINDIIKRFRQNLKDNPRFLQEKVALYFKNNQHWLTSVMKPDPNYENKMAAEEKKKLSQMTTRLGEAERMRIHSLGLQLRGKQEQEEDISCLPTLRISDIEKKMEATHLEGKIIGGKPLQVCIQPTNGLTHFRGFLSTEQLPDSLRPYLPLFCQVATKLGAGKLDYKELSQRIDLKTGGLEIMTHVVQSVDDSTLEGFEQGVSLYSHCLDHNINDMFELWKLVFSSVNLTNVDRLSALIQMRTNNLVSGISDSGSSYALTRASSILTKSAALKESYSGMAHVVHMRSIAGKSDLSETVNALEKIAEHLFGVSGKSRFAVNSTENSLRDAEGALEGLLVGLGTKSKSDGIVEPPKNLNSPKCHYVLPFPVNYIGKSVRGVSFTHSDFAPLAIVAELITNKFLHREIREKGGAYGGGAMFHSNGIFSFYSYRDPNALQTLDTFDKASKWVERANFSQQDIDEAKLAVFQSVDKPISPGNRGSRNFLYGISDQMHQKFRDKLFTVSKDDLIRVTEKYVSKPSIHGTCILGPECAAVKNRDSGWTVITDYNDL